MNIVRPQTKSKVEDWPKCSFFAIYDGHGGSTCADFLKDHLHHMIVHQECFPENPEEAIREGFKEAESMFMEYSLRKFKKTSQLDKSGSCAIAILIVNKRAYIANVGDS